MIDRRLALWLVASLFCMRAEDRDPALDPPRIILSPGPEYADANRKFQGIPGIERARNGRLWAVWYSGDTREGPQNYVVLTTSGDDGKSWSGPAAGHRSSWIHSRLRCLPVARPAGPPLAVLGASRRTLGWPRRCLGDNDGRFRF